MRNTFHMLLFLLVLGALILLSSCSKEYNNAEIINQDNIGLNTDGDLNCEGVTYLSWLLSPYVLPYPTSNAYRVLLSNCSGSHHAQGGSDQFAIDFEMGLESEVAASREGVVVLTVDSGSLNNRIVVRHSDNTFAHYVNLKKDSAAVDPGEQVVKGTILGLVGTNGAQGAPYLHFVVTTGGFGDPYISVPVTFFNTVSNPRSLEQGVIYVAEAY